MRNPTSCLTPLATLSSVEQIHQQWLELIREVVVECITAEEDRVPSYTALWHHWLRVCWVSQMYANSPQQDVFQNLPLPEISGWKFSEDGRYTIDWESREVQDRVKGTIEFLTKGCTCKRGCQTRQCSCKSSQNFVALVVNVVDVLTYQ